MKFLINFLYHSLGLHAYTQMEKEAKKKNTLTVLLLVVMLDAVQHFFSQRIPQLIPQLGPQLGLQLVPPEKLSRKFRVKI